MDELRDRFRAVLLGSFTDEERTAIAHHALADSVFQPCKEVVTQLTSELLLGGYIVPGGQIEFMRSLMTPIIGSAGAAIARVPGLEPMSFSVYSVEKLVDDALSDLDDRPGEDPERP